MLYEKNRKKYAKIQSFLSTRESTSLNSTEKICSNSLEKFLLRYFMQFKEKKGTWTSERLIHMRLVL